MADEKNIDKIRELIFGDSEKELQTKLTYYEQRIDHLEKMVSAQGSNHAQDIQEKFAQLEQKFEKHYQTLDNSFTSILESNLESNNHLQSGFDKELQLQKAYLDESLNAMRDIYENDIASLQNQLKNMLRKEDLIEVLQHAISDIQKR